MPNFTYTRDIPDGPNDPSEDQPIMKVNANSIDSIIAVEHFGFNNNNGGLHQQVTMPVRGSNAPVSGASQGALFTKTVTGAPELFYRYGSAPQNTFQITNNGAISTGANFASGDSSLIGPEAFPLKIQWGKFDGVPGFGTFVGGHAAGALVFPAPYTTALYVVICVPILNNPGAVLANDPASAASVDPDIANSDKTQFRWVFNSDSADYTGFFWAAIGS